MNYPRNNSLNPRRCDERNPCMIILKTLSNLFRLEKAGSCGEDRNMAFFIKLLDTM